MFEGGSVGRVCVLKLTARVYVRSSGHAGRGGSSKVR